MGEAPTPLGREGPPLAGGKAIEELAEIDSIDDLREFVVGKEVVREGGGGATSPKKIAPSTKADIKKMCSPGAPPYSIRAHGRLQDFLK